MPEHARTHEGTHERMRTFIIHTQIFLHTHKIFHTHEGTHERTHAHTRTPEAAADATDNSRGLLAVPPAQQRKRGEGGRCGVRRGRKGAEGRGWEQGRLEG